MDRHQLTNLTLSTRLGTDEKLAYCVCVSFFFFFYTRSAFLASFVGLGHCLWTPQTSFFNKTFIKNGFHGTIHTFKNYFATVFFSFQQNKRYPNAHYVSMIFFSLKLKTKQKKRK